MARSSRSSSRKANNQRLKEKVFGPIETARMERLSSKLLGIAEKPKPVNDTEMKNGGDKNEGMIRETLPEKTRFNDCANRPCFK